MSAMAEMSRAVRHVIEDHAGPELGLRGVPTEALQDFVTILGAFCADANDELRRRSLKAVPRMLEAEPMSAEAVMQRDG